MIGAGAHGSHAGPEYPSLHEGVKSELAAAIASTAGNLLTAGHDEA